MKKSRFLVKNKYLALGRRSWTTRAVRVLLIFIAPKSTRLAIAALRFYPKDPQLPLSPPITWQRNIRCFLHVCGQESVVTDTTNPESYHSATVKITVLDSYLVELKVKGTCISVLGHSMHDICKWIYFAISCNGRWVFLVQCNFTFLVAWHVQVIIDTRWPLVSAQSYPEIWTPPPPDSELRRLVWDLLEIDSQRFTVFSGYNF